MVERATFLTLALVLTLAFAGPADAAERCTARGAHVVLENKQARLFWVKGKGDTKRRYLGCRRGHKPILVARDTLTPARGTEPYSSSSNRRFRLSGRWVAWVRSSYVDFGVGEFGRAIRTRPLGGGGRRVSQGLSGFYRSVGSLAVHRSGAVAWILDAGQIPNGLYAEVGGVAAGARVPDVIAYARGIARRSVSFDGSGGVTWSQDGTARTAVLAGDAPTKPRPAPGPERLDPRFGTCGVARGPAGFARRLARAPSGGIVAAGTGPQNSGSFTPVSDSWVVTRMSDDGRLDESFGDHGVATVKVPRPPQSFDAHLGGLAIQPDGKIVLGGYVLLGNGADRRAVLARLDADGKLDESFGTGGFLEDALPGRSAPINDIALAADGGIVAVGGVRDSTTAGGSRDADFHFAVARFRADGSIDPGFGNGGVASTPGIGSSEANAVRILGDGSILAGGRSSEQFALVRLWSDGSFDPAFGGGDGVTYASAAGAGAITALTVAPDGRVWVTGTATNIKGFDQLVLGRFAADGSADASFGRDGFRIDGGVKNPTSIAIDSSGRPLVAAAVADPYNGGLARYLADGSRDTAFGRDGRLYGTSKQGNPGDVLLNADGTALLTRQVDNGLAVLRFAVEEPALTAAAAGVVCPAG